MMPRRNLSDGAADFAAATIARVVGDLSPQGELPEEDAGWRQALWQRARATTRAAREALAALEEFEQAHQAPTSLMQGSRPIQEMQFLGPPAF